MVLHASYCDIFSLTRNDLYHNKLCVSFSMALKLILYIAPLLEYMQSSLKVKDMRI